MAENDFMWIYLLFFIIPLARILPRIIRKYRGEKLDNNVHYEKQLHEPNETAYERTEEGFDTKHAKESKSQTTDMLVLGELNKGVRKFETIQKNLFMDNKTLESTLDKLEKQGLMKVVEKQGVLGSKVELYPTDEGFKKYYS